MEGGPSSRAAVKTVNFVAALTCHLRVKVGYWAAAAAGCWNKCRGPQVPGMTPNTSTSSSSPEDYKWTGWFSSQPVPMSSHLALCILPAVDGRPSLLLKRTAEAKVCGLLKSVTDILEPKRGTYMENCIVFEKTHVSSINFAASADKMLQLRQSLFKETRR